MIGVRWGKRPITWFLSAVTALVATTTWSVLWLPHSRRRCPITGASFPFQCKPKNVVVSKRVGRGIVRLGMLGLRVSLDTQKWREKSREGATRYPGRLCLDLDLYQPVSCLILCKQFLPNLNFLLLKRFEFHRIWKVWRISGGDAWTGFAPGSHT